MDFDNMLSYCRQLALHNDREWFHKKENHDWYRSALKDFSELLGLLRFVIIQAAPAMEDGIMAADPKSWIYRIPRDMRMPAARLGPPYNPSLRAYISKDKHNWGPIGYFIRIAPGSSHFGTGMFMETTAETNRVRDFLSQNAVTMDRLLGESGLILTGERLKTLPRGYSPDIPGQEYVRMKYWLIGEDIADADFGDFSSFAEKIRSLTERMEPLRLFWMRACS